jgi:cytochrome-b5 reductase
VRRGHFDLMVKVYPEGKMSKHIGDLKEGDLLDFKGPIMKLPYEPNMKKKIGMIAGATL